MQIVVASIENGQPIVKLAARDGTPDDWRRLLRETAAHKRVFTYDRSEPDPLGRARRDLAAERYVNAITSGYVECM